MGDTTPAAVVSPQERSPAPEPPAAASRRRLRPGRNQRPAPRRRRPGFRNPRRSLPAAPPPPQLEAGAKIAMTSNAEITTRRNKVGDQFVATVSAPVLTDAAGR